VCAVAVEMERRGRGDGRVSGGGASDGAERGGGGGLHRGAAEDGELVLGAGWDDLLEHGAHDGGEGAVEQQHLPHARHQRRDY
jgi:hypothetical protein